MRSPATAPSTISYPISANTREPTKIGRELPYQSTQEATQRSLTADAGRAARSPSAVSLRESFRRKTTAAELEKSCLYVCSAGRRTGRPSTPPAGLVGL